MGSTVATLPTNRVMALPVGGRDGCASPSVADVPPDVAKAPVVRFWSLSALLGPFTSTIDCDL